MRNFKWTVVVALVLSLVGVADAYTRQVYSGSIYDINVTIPDNGGSVGTGVEPIIGVVFTVVNKTRNPGYDPHRIIADEGLGYTGIAGLLHQQTFIPEPDGTPTQDNLDFATDIDSHWLVRGSGGVGAWENFNMLPSAEPGDTTGPFAVLAEVSYGTRLAGTFSVIDMYYPGPSWDFAYVAFGGRTVHMDLRIEGDLGGEDISTYESYSFAEPSILGTSGPYTVHPGQQVTLQARALAGMMFAEDYNLMWDLDGVGGFDDGTGVEITLDFNAAYALLGPGTHAIGVYGELVDWPMDPDPPYSVKDVAYTTLTIIPEPATFSLLAMGGLAALRRKRR